MKNVCFNIIIIITLLLNASFKQKSDDVIIWNKNEKLKWSDFMATADDKTDITKAAISSCNIKHTIYNMTSDTIYIKVYALFFKKESWKDSLIKQSDYCLKHEQTHFDITELYARKYRKVLSVLKIRRGEEYKILEQYNKIKDEWSNYQDAYDVETNHSSRKPKQEEWNKKVSKELKSLEAYSNTELKLQRAK